jgi:hypothetical protein
LANGCAKSRAAENQYFIKLDNYKIVRYRTDLFGIAPASGFLWKGKMNGEKKIQNFFRMEI